MDTPEFEAPIIVARGVSRSIQDQVLLHPVDVTAGPGACVAVLGPNGAGKTTLLRILAGHLRPTTGEVHCRGASIDERDPQIRRTIAPLLTAPAFYPDLTLVEQLRLIGVSWGFGPDEADGRADEAFARFDIAPLQHRFVHELSSGQTQLFTLAATFARPAQVYILDEPEQRLDPDRKDLLVEAVLDETDAGACVIMSCHDRDLVDRVADSRITLG